MVEGTAGNTGTVTDQALLTFFLLGVEIKSKWQSCKGIRAAWKGSMSLLPAKLPCRYCYFVQVTKIKCQTFTLLSIDNI